MSRRNISSGSIAVLGGLSYIFRDEIKTLISYMYGKGKDMFDEKMYATLCIDKVQNRMIYAIDEEIINIKSNTYHVMDGSKNIRFKNGKKHFVVYHSDQKIMIDIFDDHILMYSFLGSIEILKNYAEMIFKNHCSPTKQLMYYSMCSNPDVPNSNIWGFPIFRKPRIYSLNDNIKSVLNHVEEFFNKDGGIGKIGIMLSGSPGTGKSSTIEIIANTYNMPIYLMNIRDNMDNVDIINLMSAVPPRSIIAFEELEKQIRTNIYSGLLTALDGLPRLNNGIIIVATVNDINNIDADIKEPLLRKGRFDFFYEFKYY